MPDELFFHTSIRAAHACGHGLAITLEDVGKVEPFGSMSSSNFPLSTWILQSTFFRMHGISSI